MNKSITIHPSADVQSTTIGDRTRIWQFVVILPEAKIGSDVNICSHCFIENEVSIGDRVTIKSGVQLWDGIDIEQDVFIGPNVSFTNDKFPRSKHYPEKYSKTLIKKGASIGAGAVILPGIIVGECAMIGAGAVVTRSVPANGVVIGQASRLIKHVENEPQISTIKPEAQIFEPHEIGVGKVTLHQFKMMSEPSRGDLCVGEFLREIPFTPKRYFLVFHVPCEKIRGEHAHHQCQQFLICVKGSCVVMVDDGKRRQEIALNSADKGLYLPPLTWGVQYQFSQDAVLLVFASEFYEGSDYIRDYTEFCKLSGGCEKNA